MGKPSHPYRPYFELITNPNNKSNKFAVCLCCIEEYTRSVAITKKECRVINRARSCHDHLEKCENFKKRYSEKEYTAILALRNDKYNNKPKEGVEKRNAPSDKEVESNKRAKISSTQVVRQTSLTNYASRPLSTQDVPHFHQLFFNMVVSNGLPFSFVENPETRELFRFCIPAIKLPSAKALSGPILKDTSKELIKNIIATAQKDPNGVTAAFDGWTNIRSENLFGVIFITSEGKSLTWGAKDISPERTKIDDVIYYIKDIMEQASKHEINIKCFVSDSAGEYVAARRLLRAEYKDKIFLPCIAHQLSLVFGDIFRESEKYKDTSTKAIRIVNFFHMAPYFTSNLKEEQMLIYNKTITLTRPGDVRWNSYYFCFHNLLKTEAALKSLAAKFSPQRSKSRRATNTSTTHDKLLPTHIVQIINDPSFWSALFELQNLMIPLCGFLNKLQKDVARLHEVLHIFAYTMKLFRELPDLEFSSKMIEQLEKRWAQWEQPLLLLSFILHPHYGVETFHSTAKRVTYTDFGQWLNYYYEVWFDCRPKSILLEFVKFKRGQYPFDPQTVKQFGQDIMSFWESCSGHTPELSRLALHLYSVCVNATSVEQLWSTMGFFHTRRRNRSENKKVLDMSRIRSDILYKRQIKEIEEGEKQARRLHISSLILNNQENDNSGEKENETVYEEDEEDLNGSDLEDDYLEENCSEHSDNFEKDDDFHWSETCAHWINLVDRENQFENDDDDHLLKMEYNFFAAGRDSHPADDETAKWNLEYLFDENLKAPTFLGMEFNCSNDNHNHVEM